MGENEIIEKYQLSRRAYLNKQDIIKLFGLNSRKLENQVFSNLKVRIVDYLNTIGKKLDDLRYLPTDLVFKFADNQSLLKQIEKDYSEMMKRKEK